MRRLIAAACAGFPLLACADRPQRMLGSIANYETHRPVSGATVVVTWRGWGRSGSGGIVWDKGYSETGHTSADGTFEVVYRGPSSAEVTVLADGFQPFSHWYGNDATATIVLKPRDPGYHRVDTGLLSLGEAPSRATAGNSPSLGGWRFSSAEETRDSLTADLLVSAITFEPKLRVVVRAMAAGGVRFVSAADIGAPAALLVYTDSAPADGYAKSAALEPGSRPGILFVRTADGMHFAKLEVASAMTQQAPNGGRRAASFRYVFNAAGGRDLRFEEP